MLLPLPSTLSRHEISLPKGLGSNRSGVGNNLVIASLFTLLVTVHGLCIAFQQQQSPVGLERKVFIVFRRAFEIFIVALWIVAVCLLSGLKDASNVLAQFAPDKEWVACIVLAWVELYVAPSMFSLP